MVIVRTVVKIVWKERVNTAQKMKFSMKDFYSKCDQIRSLLWIWSNLLNKSFMENFVFYCKEII